jgi:anti-anti-sigma factor
MTTLRDDSELPDYCAFIRETVSSAEILHVLGDIDISSIGHFERALDDTVRPARPLVIDLTTCDYIGAAGFASLVRTHRALGKGMRVAVSSEGIPARLFSLLESHARFFIAGSIEGALHPPRLDARAF